MTILSMKLKKKLISQAINVLKETKNHEESRKKALFEDDNSLFFQVSLKKVPKTNGVQMITVNLPHSLLKNTDEVCLITGDTNKNFRKAETEPDVLHYRALLDKHGVTNVSKIVTLRQLRTDYKAYADRLKLLAAYDVFLADDVIYECLPRALGRFFYKKRKFPLRINMKTSNLKQQIERALSMKRFIVTGNGNSCSSEVAYLDMSDSEILANVEEMLNTVSKEMPGSWDNILGIYLKTARSKAIPIYVSYGNPNDVILEEKEMEEELIIDELSTKPNVNAKIHKDGKIELFTAKKPRETCLNKDSKTVKADSEERNKYMKSQKSEVKEERNECGKKKKQKSFDDKIDKNEMPIKKEKVFVAVPEKKKKKSGKNKMQKNCDDNDDKSLIENNAKSKKEKNVLDKDIRNLEVEDDLLERKKKTVVKRKREQSASESKEKVFSFGSPKQETKKIKIDSENLKKPQPFKKAGKKIRQKKTK